MQTVTIDTRAPDAPARIIRQIHERDVLGAWRAIAGIDLRSWLIGSRLVVGAEDGPNTAVIEADGHTLHIEHESDADGWFVRAAVEAMARHSLIPYQM